MLDRFACLLVSAVLGGTAAAEFKPPRIMVADGYEVTLAARPPLVGYPMMACLDDRGRLYVAESDGRNLTSKEEILKERPRFVRRLSDTDGDGIYDHSTIFADNMTMPEGGLWHDGALYIISAPYLWRLEDLDDDGVADKREKILGTMEFDGRANQHGPYLGPNGRLYFSGGHFGYDLVGTDGSRSGSSRAAAVFSCRPDGSDVRVEGQGGINPVDVVFTRSGEMLSTCAIFDSFGGQRHDALIHWIPGGLTQRVYGLPLLPETGHRLPAVSRWGQVAPAGLLRYRGNQFGHPTRERLFACHFNTNKVVQIDLLPQGASFTTEERDFLSSTSSDFHPADILEDVDGSLLLLDTGGWLSWGCPHSKIAKPEVNGAIYRIRRKGAPALADPRGDNISWQDQDPAALAGLLSLSRPAVRDRARAALLARGPLAVPPLVSLLNDSSDPRHRLRCAWTLSRIDTPQSRLALRHALRDEDSAVRSAAARSLGEWRDRPAAPALQELLTDTNAAVRRNAASALGRIGESAAIPSLLSTLQPDSELHLRHAITLALIEIDEPTALLPFLKETHPIHHRQTALRVLSQSRSELLTPSLVVPLLQSPHPALRDEARRIIGDQESWRAELLGIFTDLLEEPSPSHESSQLLEEVVLSIAADETFHRLAVRKLQDETPDPAQHLRMLSVLSHLPNLPAALHDSVRRFLDSPDPALKAEALALILHRGLAEPKPFLAGIHRLANEAGEPAVIRCAALEILAKHDRTLRPDQFVYLSGLLDAPETPLLTKRQATRALAALQLAPDRPELASRLCALISNATALQLPPLLEPFERLELNGWPAKELDSLGNALASALRSSPGRNTVKGPRLHALAEKFKVHPNAHSAFQSLVAASGEDDKQRETRLTALLTSVSKLGANASRGRVLFHSNRATCSLCHQAPGGGGSLGPDLSQIARIRGRKDLLEAILYPNATIVNGFETHLLTTTDGRNHAGLVHRESPAAVYLRNTDQRIERIPREKISSFQRSPVSSMPEGLAQIFSDQELADLLAFLESCR